jgi:hypothetical protein
MSNVEVGGRAFDQREKSLWPSVSLALCVEKKLINRMIADMGGFSTQRLRDQEFHREWQPLSLNLSNTDVEVGVRDVH